MSIGVKKGISSPKVWTQGKNIPIEELHVGDTILAVDENNQVVDTTVQALFEYELDEWIEIIVERSSRYDTDQTKIDRFLCSPEHPWLTNRGWIRAGELEQTDEIYFVDYKEKLSHRLKGEKNPIHDPITMTKHLENTDWEKMGRTQASTIAKKKGDGTYIGSIVRLRDLDPERYEELRQKHSQRLTENNPMHDPKVVRESAGMHQNINEHYPYMSLSEKRFAEMCESQGLPVEYVGRFDLPIKHNGKTHYPDFRVQGTNRLIEVYWDTGKYSHRKEEWKEQKLEAYRANGYECTFANFAVVPEVRDQVDALKEEMLVHNGRTIRSIRKFKYKEKWWDKEEGFSISRNRLKAYDLTCAPYNTFIVDGLVTHNCGGFKAKLLEAKKATWYCLDGDTSIVHRIGNGGKAPIKDIQVGDTVLGYDEVNHQAVPTKVIRKIEHTVKDTSTYIITTQSGSVVEATGEHPFFVDEKWVRADELKVGDEIYHVTGFEALLLDMDTEGLAPERSPSNHISVERARHLQSVVGKFIHNGDPIVSIEVKHYDEKVVHNLECFPHKNFFTNRLLSHNCDTESVWKAGRDLTTEQLMDEIFTKYPRLKRWIAEGVANIILTGGEPTLPHNIEAIKDIQAWFHAQSIYPYYEVETNGSMVVDYETLFDQINASPKLANSGMPARLRQNKEAIEAIKAHPNAWFKFVVNIEDDIREIENEWIGELGVPEDRIILMPGCDKVDDLQRTSLFAAERAIERGWRFSSRLQVSIWNQLTGV